MNKSNRTGIMKTLLILTVCLIIVSCQPSGLLTDNFSIVRPDTMYQYPEYNSYLFTSNVDNIINVYVLVNGDYLSIDELSIDIGKMENGFALFEYSKELEILVVKIKRRN